jgi:hypothetical protein
MQNRANPADKQGEYVDGRCQNGRNRLEFIS